MWSNNNGNTWNASATVQLGNWQSVATDGNGNWVAAGLSESYIMVSSC
jgi:hypothetical protein